MKENHFVIRVCCTVRKGINTSCECVAKQLFGGNFQLKCGHLRRDTQGFASNKSKAFTEIQVHSGCDQGIL